MSEGKPRVLMLTEPLAAPVSAMAGGAFEIVGPWTVDGPWEAHLARHGAGITAAISSSIDNFDAHLLALLPDLKHISVFGAGMDGVDLAVAEQRGIAVTSGGAIHSGEVADHAVGMMIAARRRLVESDAWVRQGQWQGEARFPPTVSLRRQKVGIIGLGHIGMAIAERAQVFSPDIAWWGPRDKPAPWPRKESLHALAEWADILFVAARADDASRGLVDGRVIEALGAGGLLINISRGFVVDEQALIAALRDGRLGQAALDVFDPEPTVAARWADVPNTLLSPHNAGVTTDAIMALCAHAVQTVKDALARG
ncbi:Lactate dehydrogenase [Sphingomonas laterariae]|uniref:Lactate dehydrogenase n=1 Tax=Edaphosphingomonas laterariae TaxID=861865 RepID=A0A239BW12_9SPHN|nr:NAD(P)-dependent oxidoreductase [Sphingomonas laterariae]SNS12090.1 Lactate dehydrogenase [Sphingomonas laterariae]